MKTTLSIFAAALITISSAFAGIDAPEASATGMAIMKQGSMIKLFYKGTKTADVKVAIYNASNRIVFSETIRNVDGFVRPYNFSSLNEGEYSIVLTGENGRQVERVTYTLGKVEKLANVLQISGDKNRYMLTVANKGKDALTVKIYDQKGTLVYNETEQVEGDYARVFSLNQVLGAVTFEVSDSKGITKLISL